MNSGLLTPRHWPGAANLQSWHAFWLGKTYSTTLYAEGTTPPGVTVSGTIPENFGLRIEITTGGSRGTAVFRWSSDNGTSWTSSVTTAASVALGSSGVNADFAAGTYATDNVYQLKITSWADQGGASNTFAQASLMKAPIPRVLTAGRMGLGFDGTQQLMQCTTGLANTLLSGNDTAHMILGAVHFDSVAADQTMFSFCNGAVDTSLYDIFPIASTSKWRFNKRGTTGSLVMTEGGTPTTGIHVFRINNAGTTVALKVDGSTISLSSSGALDANSLTVNTLTLAATFIAGAEANRGALTWLELLTYNANPSSAIGDDIENRLLRRYGFI